MIKKMDDRPKCPPHFGKNAPPKKPNFFNGVFFADLGGVGYAGVRCRRKVKYFGKKWGYP